MDVTVDQVKVPKVKADKAPKKKGRTKKIMLPGNDIIRYEPLFDGKWGTEMKFSTGQLLDELSDEKKVEFYVRYIKEYARGLSILGLVYKPSKQSRDGAQRQNYDSVERLIEHYVICGYQDIAAFYKTPTRNVEAAKSLLKKARSAWEQNVKRKTQIQLNVLVDKALNDRIKEELARRRQIAQNLGGDKKMISKDKLVAELIAKGLDRFESRRNFAHSVLVQNGSEKSEEKLCDALTE